MFSGPFRTKAIRVRPVIRIVSAMLNLDPAKLLVIAVVAIILLGPDRLPRVARQAGAAWRTFNDFRHRMESEVRSSMPDLPSTTDIARLARSPSALLNHLSNLDSGTVGTTTVAEPTCVETPFLPDATTTQYPLAQVVVAHDPGLN